MKFSISYIREDNISKSKSVSVGWLYNDEKSSIVYFPPEKLKPKKLNKEHSKSASRCPAVIGLESRYVQIKCPFDIHIAFERDKNGKPALRNCAGTKSSIRPGKLNQLLTITEENEWRYDNCPIIQLQLPYVFIADEPVYISQIPPIFHYQERDPMPGTIFGGRFPIDIWPRPLMWAFEWHNLEKELILKRGQPLFYCQFEFDSPERNFELVEAQRTNELNDYLDKISAAVNYVDQTFSLFKQAKDIRPTKLLIKKEQ